MSSGLGWSDWEHRVLRALFPIRSFAEIAVVVQRTEHAVKSRTKIFGLRQGKKKIWTATEDRILRKLYPETPTALLARRFGCSIFQTYAHANRLGVMKSAEYMERCGSECGAAVQPFGASHRYPKGHVPANKGLRRPGYSPGRMSETQFKKGEMSGVARAKWCPVGTVKLNGDGYLVRKIADIRNNGRGAQSRNWEFVHKRVWEEAHGPIPPGHRIWWKDGDHMNCALENLELLNDKEHMARTTVHNLPPELVQVIQLTGALKRKIRNREKRLNGEEQDRGLARPPVRDAGSVEGLREAAG